MDQSKIAIAYKTPELSSGEIESLKPKLRESLSSSGKYACGANQKRIINIF
jgi:hypothetical protein